MKRIMILFSLLLFSTTFVFSQSTSLSLGSVQAKVGDTVNVPINVSNLNNAGAISLKISYDNVKLSFIGLANPAVTFSSNATGGVIALGWFDATAANPLSITSGILANLKLVVTSGSGTNTVLSFKTAESELANSLGTPINVLYNSGAISIEAPPAPILKISSAVANAGAKVVLPIKVSAFNSIGAISLKINYDSNVLTFDSLTNVTSGKVFTSSAVNGVITIGWFDATGNTPLTVADSATLVSLNFTYVGSSAVSNVTFNSSACELSNQSGSPIANITYTDGSVSPYTGNLPTLTLGNLVSAANASIVVPIDAKNLKSVGALSLKVKYNAALLTFNGVSNAANGITFTSSASSGTITLGWFDATGNSPLNLSSAKLVDLNFSILSGSGNLEFLTAQCEISDSIGQVISGVNYVNGSVLTVALPATPNLLSPVNGAAKQPLSVVLKWSSVLGATSYQVQVSKDSLFGAFVKDSILTADSLVVASLVNDTKYFWKVKSINAAGSSSFSSVFSYQTIVALSGVPVLVSPANNAVNELIPVKIKWNKVVGATSYHVQVSTSDLFTTFVKNDSTITADSLVLSSLLNDTKYFWRVKSINAAGSSDFSSAFNFKSIVAIPAAPLLVSPLSGNTITQDSLKLVWYGVTGTTSYKLQVSKSNTFSTIWLEKSALADTSLVVSQLDSNATYYWRVYASNVAGMSSASSVWNFVTKIPVGITKIDQFPTTYMLSQNFPNPFNPTTVIRYDLPKEGLVTLKVYDMLGKEVTVLVNQNQSVGKYSVTFDASSLTSGVYIYRIQANDFISVKKLLLLK